MIVKSFWVGILAMGFAFVATCEANAKTQKLSPGQIVLLCLISNKLCDGSGKIVKKSVKGIDVTMVEIDPKICTNISTKYPKIKCSTEAASEFPLRNGDRICRSSNQATAKFKLGH